MVKLAGAENNTGFTVEVNGETFVKVFDKDGRSVLVKEDETQEYLDNGYRDTPLDINLTVSNFVQALERVKDTAIQYVDELEEDGFIDPDDQKAGYVLQTAVAEANKIFDQLVADVAYKYPIRQGESVTLVDGDGKEIQVDPSQVEDYKAEGFKESK